MDGANRCRACGYDLEYLPWGEDGVSPTYDSCSCCGCEAGYEDATKDAARRYRQQWLDYR